MSEPKLQRIRILDSHTGGEPTRLVLEGGPDLGRGPLAERVKLFREKFDSYRSAIVNEPRGSDVVVGALLVEPHTPGCQFGVIFFNNVGYLGMCGHGTIGLVVSLAHLGRVTTGTVRIDTPVGPVEVGLHPNGTVSVNNVASWRKAAGIAIQVPGIGAVRGDVAWGGNWFFLVEEHGQELELTNIEALTDYTWRVRQAVNAQGFPEVDHVELFAPSSKPGVNSRNFVLCPGKAYDRSPCGTGTSAKLACLAAAGKLAEGAEWVQESIVGSVFRGRYRRDGDKVIPTITGGAHVSGEGVLLLDAADPFRWGIR
ncbi:MAG TPA: proline racemase family protein [Candidatus Didemnitutus sp.]|nr:proline racemase family protein [Candidatus Didemnitutus sp.]